MPDGFPLEPIDVEGQKLGVGDTVTVLSVDSCARNLPENDQVHLRSIVGKQRCVMAFDLYGFVWLSFTAEDSKADFCLFPVELRRDQPT